MFSFLTSANADRKKFNAKNLNGVWEEGKQVCFSCEKPFSFMMRRHHCRQCGKECCSTCSALKVEGDRACIFCFVSLKSDVLAAVNASRLSCTPPKGNINERDLSVGSDRSTLQSFVYNHSTVSMGDFYDDNTNNINNDNNDNNEIERSNNNDAQTPLKERDENSNKIDTFVAPWSISPSSAGNSANNSNINSPIGFSSNSSTSNISTPLVALKSAAIIDDLHINEINEPISIADSNSNEVTQVKDTAIPKASSRSNSTTIEADKENSVNTIDS
jgi:hypothetical protein